MILNVFGANTQCLGREAFLKESAKHKRGVKGIKSLVARANSFQPRSQKGVY